MTKIAAKAKAATAAALFAATTALVPMPSAQAAPAAPAPEALGSFLGVSCVISIGDDCGTTGSGGGGLFYIGGVKANPPARYDFFVFNPTVPLSLIPVLGPPLAGWFASLNFEACVGGVGARIGPYGSVSASIGRGC